MSVKINNVGDLKKFLEKYDNRIKIQVSVFVDRRPDPNPDGSFAGTDFSGDEEFDMNVIDLENRIVFEKRP